MMANDETNEINIEEELKTMLAPKFFFIEDVPFVYGGDERKKQIERVLEEFEFRSDDVIICGYPRSGL